MGMGHEDERTFTHNPWVAGGLLVEREGNEMRDLHWMLSRTPRNFFNAPFLYELLCTSAIESLCDHTTILFSLGERSKTNQVSRPNPRKDARKA
jgi:hypothetical protein